MRRDLTLVIAVAVLVASVGAAWWTHRYATDLALQHDEKTKELNIANERQEMASKTRARVEGLDKALRKVEDQVKWDPDPTYPTYILRWFADTAEETGAHLINSQVMPGKKGEDLAGDKKLRRTRYSVRIQGSYADLVRYLDRVERSPHVMVVEEFTLGARRNGGDEGELELTASALWPIGLTDQSSEQDETVSAGEGNE